MSSAVPLDALRDTHAPRVEPLDVERVRQDFPILQRKVRGKPLVYLDNAASSQRPRVVIEAIRKLYEQDYANIHRGVHTLSQVATEAYENSRDKVRQFIGAADRREIVFTRGTTESINLVANSFARPRLQPGDEILITAMEHHANIVPWQLVCEQTGARLRVAPISDEGILRMEEFARLLTPRTRLVAAVHVSNALGTINPIRRMIELAHAAGIPILIDGAQAAPHLRVNVQQLDCDFYAFSGHKMCGPTGIGVLYGKLAHLEAMPPWQGGGDMINVVTFEKTTYNDPPQRFEAGTPNIEGGIALAPAIDYLLGLGMDRIAAWENELLAYATQCAADIPGLRIIGTAPCKASVLSFVLDCAHPHDIGTILDQEGVAIRTGHHCAQPVMQRFNVPATARASFSFYNTREEVDALFRGLRKVLEVFG